MRENKVTIRLRIEPLAEGGYVATSPDVPGPVAQAGKAGFSRKAMRE